MESQTSRPRRSYRVSNKQFVQDQPRAKWTVYLTRILADLMVGQVYKGNRPNNSFSKQAWEYMCNDFQAKTGLNWDKEQLKSRHVIMKKQHAMVKSLLDMNDFSWDESLSMVNGKDETWDEYIKAHPDAEAIRTNGCPYYKQLCIIFRDPPQNEEELSSSTEEHENKSKRRRNQNRIGPEDMMAKAISEIAAASKLRTIAVTKSMESFSISRCVAALDEMEGVDDDLYYTALDLFDKPNAREMFMALKVDKRLVWLKGKCFKR